MRIRTSLYDELIAESIKLRVLYNALEVSGGILSPKIRISELVAACAPTLCVLKCLHHCWSLSFPVMSSRAQPYTYSCGSRRPRLLDDLHRMCTADTPAFMDQDRDAVNLNAVLASTTSSPFFLRTELALNGAPSTREVVDFSREKWGTLEDVLLELTRRSGNVIQLVISFQGWPQLPH